MGPEPAAASGPRLSWVHSRLEYRVVPALQRPGATPGHPPDAGAVVGSLTAAGDSLTNAAPCSSSVQLKGTQCQPSISENTLNK